MEPVLRAHLHSFPLCQYRQGWRFLSYQQSSDFVDYLVQEIASGIEQRIRCRYLVSCEGAHSGIRRAMEATLDGRDCISKFCTTYLRAPALDALWPPAPAWMH